MDVKNGSSNFQEQPNFDFLNVVGSYVGLVSF